MTLKNHLLKMLDAEIWANRVIVETLENAKDADERCFFLLSHLMNSYSMWLSRILGTEINVGLFEERSLPQNSELMKAVFASLKAHLERADEKEITRVIEFTFPLDGSRRKLSVADAVTHLVTHSTYHRGQIISRLKGTVEPLPLTTYIAFAMEKA